MDKEDKWPNDLEIKIEPNFREPLIRLTIKTMLMKLIKIDRFNKWKKLVKVTSLVLCFLKIKLALRSSKYTRRIFKSTLDASV